MSARHRDAAVARPGPRPPRGPAAAARQDAASLQGREPQALALPRRFLRGGDGLRGARQRRVRRRRPSGRSGTATEQELTERTVMRLPGARGEVWFEDGEGAAGRQRSRRRLGRADRGDAPRGGPRPGLPSHRRRRRGPSACAPTARTGSSGPGSASSRSTSTSASASGASAARLVASRTSPRATTRRHTVWSWSAGVGTLTDGREVGWNLVEGVNDPPERSERAIWVDGEPFEPGPSDVRRPRDGHLRGRLGHRVRGRGRALAHREARSDLLLLPPAVRHLHRNPARRARARERHGRDGEPRRDAGERAGCTAPRRVDPGLVVGRRRAG